jgi:HSP20 family molecular chaperone IbpA
LPENVDSNKIAAKYVDGVLNLTIPKKEEAQKNTGQKIKVE